MQLIVSSNKRYSPKLFAWLIVTIPLVILVISFLIEPYGDANLFRTLRVGVSFLFLVASWVLYGNRLSTLVYWHMLFYGLSSIAAIFYEEKYMGELMMLLNFFSFVFLVVLLLRQIRFNEINIIFLIALILGVVTNIWLIWYLMVMLYEIHQSLSLLITICISISGSFTVTVLALIHNYEHKSKSSILFFLFIVLIVFAETFRGAGHYDIIDPEIGQYCARALLLIGYVFLFSYCNLVVFHSKTDLLS